MELQEQAPLWRLVCPIQRSVIPDAVVVANGVVEIVVVRAVVVPASDDVRPVVVPALVVGEGPAVDVATFVVPTDVVVGRP